jgi:osmotically inducible protein OsmC
MPLAERQADVVWQGDLAHGKGQLSAKSGAFSDLPVTWASRTERSNGMTSPEELLAAAHAACFSMALSHGLAQGGHAPERLDVTAVCTLDRTDAGPRVASMALTVRGKVPGLDQAGFKQAAEAAKDGCPVSNAFKNNLQLSVDATLES